MSYISECYGADKLSMDMHAPLRTIEQRLNLEGIASCALR